MKTEREEAEEKPFVIRPYLKSELAHKYNPHLPLIYAMQKLRDGSGIIKNLMMPCIAVGKGKTIMKEAGRRRYLREERIVFDESSVCKEENKLAISIFRLAIS